MNEITNYAHMILRLDSIYGLLHWTERIRLHLAINNRLELEPTPMMIALYGYIIRTAWIPPEMRYLKDNDGLFCHHRGGWIPAEEYKELNPIKYN